MNARYFILTDEESNTYGVVLIENDFNRQKIKNIMIDQFGDDVRIIWSDNYLFVVQIGEDEYREFYLTETELL